MDSAQAICLSDPVRVGKAFILASWLVLSAVGDSTNNSPPYKIKVSKRHFYFTQAIYSRRLTSHVTTWGQKIGKKFTATNTTRKS
jgi:hypothetical protein